MWLIHEKYLQILKVSYILTHIICPNVPTRNHGYSLFILHHSFLFQNLPLCQCIHSSHIYNTVSAKMTGLMFMTRQEVKLFYNLINQYFPCPKKKQEKKSTKHIILFIPSKEFRLFYLTSLKKKILDR